MENSCCQSANVIFQKDFKIFGLQVGHIILFDKGLQPTVRMYYVEISIGN